MPRIVLSGCLGLLVFIPGCQRAPASGPGAGKFAIPVETTAAIVARVEDRVRAVGTLQADEMVQVKPEIEGRVARVAFREGDAVTKGDVLFELEGAKLRAAAAAAEALAFKAQNNLQRSRQLREQHTISQQELDDLEAGYKEARALWVLASERLADATIHSPLTGFISERLVSEGQYVEKGQTLVTVVDSDPMKIEFAVPERHLAVVQDGQEVTVLVAAVPDRSFTGRVFFIDPRVDASTRTVKLKAQIPNPDGALRAGLFANAELIVGRREQAVVVPEQAVVPAIDKLTVFVVQDGVAKRRQVTVGARLAGQVEITSGLQPGETVVIAGQQKLQDGVPVQAVERPDS